jgi:hypothetical protein
MAREFLNSKYHRDEHLVFLFIGAGKAIVWDDLIGETEPVALWELAIILICMRATLVA